MTTPAKFTFRKALIATVASVAIAGPAALAQEVGQPYGINPQDEVPASTTEQSMPQDDALPTPPDEAETDYLSEVEDTDLSEKKYELESDYAETKGDNSDTKELVSAEEKYIDESFVNVRNNHGMDGEIVEVLEEGEQVKVHAMNGGWARISAEDEAPKFIYAELLSAKAPSGQGGPMLSSEEEALDSLDSDGETTSDLNADVLSDLEQNESSYEDASESGAYSDARDYIEETEDSFDEAERAFEDAENEAAEAVDAYANDSEEEAAEAFDDARDAALEAEEEANNIANSDDAPDDLGEAAEKGWNATQDAVDDAGKAIEDAADDAGDEVSDEWDEATDK